MKHFKPTKIPDVILIEPQVFGDHRGFFMETFQAEEFSRAGITAEFVQDNHSGSARGTLRGLHYQIKQTQGKLVRCVVGEVFDVAVDIRQSSKTFGQWVGAWLTAENRHMLWVPPGFAHGFYVKSEWGELVYKASDYYAPAWERSILWNDPDIGIDWPIPTGIEPILSERDKKGSLITQAELFD